MEKGDARVPLHFIARAIHLFGELAHFSNLMDTAQDDIGLTLIDEQLPKRIRQKSKPDTGGNVKTSLNIRQQVQVCLGKESIVIGDLTYVKQGQRENTAFAYRREWLAAPDSFSLSPDLPLTPDYQQRKAASKHDSPFHFALADTAPDAWGRRVIGREHAKRRKNQPALAQLTELDYLLAVDDFSRPGALRLADANGQFLRSASQGQRSTPPLIELAQIFDASRANCVDPGKDAQQLW